MGVSEYVNYMIILGEIYLGEFRGIGVLVVFCLDFFNFRNEGEVKGDFW